MGEQNIQIMYMPEEDSEEIRGECRTTINPVEEGMGMEALLQAIEERIPIAEHPETNTLKNILSVERYECPCCQTHISAIVDVNVSGLSTEQGNSIRGLYRVYIGENWAYSKHSKEPVVVSVERLMPTVLSVAEHPNLPRRDYQSSQQAMEDLRESERFWEKMERDNPGRVLYFGSITPDSEEEQ